MAATRRYGWYLAALQFFFALTWTVYVVYLPKLAGAAGIAPKAIILILLLDQAIFTVCDFLTGIAADKVDAADRTARPLGGGGDRAFLRGVPALAADRRLRRAGAAGGHRWCGP